MTLIKKKNIISSVLILVLFITSSHFILAGSKYYKISVNALRDKIAAAWIGQMIGNIYGLPHENLYITSPGPENWPYGYTSNLDRLKLYNGAYSDDDTDIEYIYLLQMEKYGCEPSYKQLKEAWMYHIRKRVALANRGALGLMHFGFTPPFTGNKNINPHWYQIDPQLINEIWSLTAPGMIKYAAGKSAWAAHITSDDWGIEPTIHYGVMYAAAFFEKDIRKLIETGLTGLPSGGRYAQTVREMIALHDRFPHDWKSARKEMARMYYEEEPDMTKTIWNANLNGACGILALLYGNGDFQQTLDLACAMGFDADNQAATVAGLTGVIHGMQGLPENLYLPVDGWKLPFNDRYTNITRFDLPDAGINSIIDRTLKVCIDLVISKGGKIISEAGQQVLVINRDALFNPPLEFGVGPLPLMEAGNHCEYAFYSSNNKDYNWSLVSGNLPEGVMFKNGSISGIPEKQGTYPITLQLDNGINKIKKDFILLVRAENIARRADTVLSNIRLLNEAVLDSCWHTFGKSMYAKNVEVICDGKTNGPGSVFYSLAAKANLPKVDYYGYGWKKEQTIDMIVFHTGGMEEFGGWFTSLNVQYLDSNGKWVPAEEMNINPPMPETDQVHYQPHFAEYVIRFRPVVTRAIRIIGDAAVYEHWDTYTKNVSAFTSITELSVYSSVLE